MFANLEVSNKWLCGEMNLAVWQSVQEWRIFQENSRCIIQEAQMFEALKLGEMFSVTGRLRQKVKQFANAQCSNWRGTLRMSQTIPECQQELLPQEIRCTGFTKLTTLKWKPLTSGSLALGPEEMQVHLPRCPIHRFTFGIVGWFISSQIWRKHCVNGIILWFVWTN